MKRLALATAAALLTTGCGSAGPTLTADSAQNGATEGAPRVHQGDTVSIGSMFACLSAAGSVTVTQVTPVDPVGLKVTGFAMLPRPDGRQWLGVEPKTLSALNLPTGRTLNATCDNHGRGYEFVVQVEKTTRGEAGAAGWLVTYSSEGHTKQYGFALAVRLCNENVAWARSCTALKV